MAKEYSRSERVADALKRELAGLIQFEMRDPRVGMVSVTDVEVSRDLSSARVFCTILGKDEKADAEEAIQVLNKAGGFLRTQLSKASSLRTVPQLRFFFDSSVGRGVYMEELIERAVAADLEGRAPEES